MHDSRVAQNRWRSGMRHIWLAALSIAGGSLPTVSYAEGERSVEECNADNARQISVGKASRRIEKLEGACVKITGISDGWALYGSIGDIYRDTDAWERHSHSKQQAGRIGLRQFPDVDEDYDNRPEAGTWNWSRVAPRRVTFVGLLHNCGLDWSSGDPDSPDFEIRMGTGWCHYNGGAVLRPVAIVAESPAKFIRMTGRRARRQSGDIVPFHGGARFAADILALLERLFDATRRGDRRAVMNIYDYSEVKLASNGVDISEDELVRYDVDDDPAFSAKYTLDLLFGNPDTPLSQAIRNRALAIRLFSPRWTMEGGPDAWACWAAVPAAEKDWPISSIDAFNGVGRPYACISVIKDSSRAEGISVYGTVPHRPWARVEPARQ